jgi:hypothetical protein
MGSRVLIRLAQLIIVSSLVAASEIKRSKLHFKSPTAKEGTFCASELAGIGPTPPAQLGQIMPAFAN